MGPVLAVRLPCSMAFLLYSLCIYHCDRDRAPSLETELENELLGAYEAVRIAMSSDTGINAKAAKAKEASSVPAPAAQAKESYDDAYFDSDDLDDDEAGSTGSPLAFPLF